VRSETRELRELAENLDRTAAALQTSQQHREQASRELGREQQLLAQIARTSPIGITVMGGEGRITFANPRARELLQMGSDETMLYYNEAQWRITDWEGNPVKDADLTFSQIMRDGQTLYDQHLAVKPPGAEERVLLNINAAPIPLDSGLGVVATFEDVTRRVAFEERVRDLARFPDENPMPLIRASRRGHVLYGNRAGAGMMMVLGVDEYGNLPETWEERLARMLEEDDSEEFELAVDEHFYTVMAVPVPERGYVNFYAYDVTERRRLAAQLRQSQKMEAVGQLAGGIAHDFNNIVTGIIGFAGFVAEAMEPDSQAARDMVQIRELAERASHLTGQLLAFSRRQPLEPVLLDLNTVFDELSAMLQRIIGEDVELEFNPGDDLGQVSADPSQMEQVIMNLAVNARDAMPEGGHLTVSTENVTIEPDHFEQNVRMEPGDYVLVRISDTGTGMPVEVRKHAFEPFFTTKEQGKGTGLGLATVYGIVKQHEGYIWIDSEVDEGTTFRVYLPRVDEQAERPRPRPQVTPPAPDGRMRTLLVVDDEEPIMRLAARVLRGAGYRVLTAHSAQEALDKLNRYATEIDLLLTDVVLPEQSGLALYEEGQSIVQGLKVLYMSGYTAETIDRHGGIDSDTPFLQKPFPPQMLLHKVASVFE
jgi:signal transduction histidine kinase/CheY-like chemotaxis protein